MKLKLVIALFGVFLAIAIPSSLMFASKHDGVSVLRDANQLQSGITTYFTEYRKFPSRNSEPEDSNKPEFSDRTMMAFLLTPPTESTSEGMSPRPIINFVSFRKAFQTANGKHRGGISTYRDGSTELWDYWGNHYRIVMDLDGDNLIPAPSFTSSNTPIKQRVIVWSPGPDGDDATVEDNIMTWRP